MYRGGVLDAHQTLGRRSYELSNHLGNVLAVVTDNIGMNTEDTVWASVESSGDYYAFGMGMKERGYSSSGYRYGFNGKEKDDEGELGETHYDYGFRIYNPRISKFLSVDPLTKDYPWYTPYQFAGNTPIQAIDLDGLEPFSVVTTQYFSKNQATFKRIDSKTVSVWPQQWQNQANIDGVLYKLNSPATTMGRDNSNTRSPGNFTGITQITSDNLSTLMAYGINYINNNYEGNIDNAFKAESGTREGLDYKYKAFEVLNILENDLLEINGIVYNANEAGNLIWGMLYEYTGETTNFDGGYLNPALGADFITIKDQHRVDEASEQMAIKRGIKYGDKYSDDKKFNNDVKEKLDSNTKQEFTADCD